MRITTPRLLTGLSLALALLSFAPSAAATPIASSWAQESAGSGRHAYNSSERTLGATNVARLKLAAGGFSHDCCGMIRPIIVDGVVYTEVHVPGSSAVEAWDEQTGVSLWMTNTPSALTNDFAVSDGVLVVSDFYGSLLGFSTTDGSLLWTAPSSGGSDAQPVIANGVVYVDYGHIQALDLHTGAVLWTGMAITDLGMSGPTVWQNEVFQATANTIYAFDTGDGHVLWSSSCPVAPQATDRSPMVLHGVVYAGSGCAFDAVTGATIWTAGANHISLTNDATGGSRIFSGYEISLHGAAYARVEAINPTTGALIWHHDIPNPTFSQTALGEGPVVANGVVYFTDRTGTNTIIRAYSVTNGRPVWTSQPVNGVYAISIADGRIWAIFGNDALVRHWALP